MVKRSPIAALVLAAAAAAAGCDWILGIDEHGLAPASGVTSDAAAGPSGPPGCVPDDVPDADVLNRCTGAEFMVFDNCARLQLCDGAVPPLVDPPGGSPDSGEEGRDAAPSAAPGASCYDAAARPKLVFMQGSTNFTPFVRAMAPLVAKSGYTIVWQPVSSCAGAAAGGFDTGSGKNLMRNPVSAADAYAVYYDATGQGTTCLLGGSPTSPDGESEITDIGESDIFAEGCPRPSGQAPWVPGSAAYPEVGHYLGPVQAMVFLTPLLSTERAISAEAARMVFGMGGNRGAAAPWTDPARMFVRGPTTGTNNILSLAIDVPSDRWWGTDTNTAPAMQSAILASSTADAERTIGTLSSDYADQVKSGLHVLYFQAKGQIAGFLPDSTPSSADKANVRDGHYAPWGPIHLYTKLVSGQPSPQAAAFILPFTVPSQTLIDATVAGGAVPTCAMHVTRDREMGPMRPAAPGFRCDCYYDLKVTGGNACRKCAGPADCPGSAPACNLGFCEAE